MIVAMGAGEAFESVVQSDDTAVSSDILRVLHKCVIGIEALPAFGEVLKCLLMACPRASVGTVEEMMVTSLRKVLKCCTLNPWPDELLKEGNSGKRMEKCTRC